MAKHIVKCLYCEEQFDANVEAYEKVKRRYAHKECFEEHERNKTDEDRAFDELEKYILEKITHETCLSLRVRKQIEDFKNDYQYTNHGILLSLQYFYDIKGNSTEKANGGIGIVPYIYQEAFEYYNHIVKNAKEFNTPELVEKCRAKTNTVTIKSPNIERKLPKLFDMEE